MKIKPELNLVHHEKKTWTVHEEDNTFTRMFRFNRDK